MEYFYQNYMQHQLSWLSHTWSLELALPGQYNWLPITIMCLQQMLI